MRGRYSEGQIQRGVDTAGSIHDTNEYRKIIFNRSQLALGIESNKY